MIVVDDKNDEVKGSKEPINEEVVPDQGVHQPDLHDQVSQPPLAATGNPMIEDTEPTQPANTNVSGT